MNMVHIWMTDPVMDFLPLTHPVFNAYRQQSNSFSSMQGMRKYMRVSQFPPVKTILRFLTTIFGGISIQTPSILKRKLSVGTGNFSFILARLMI